MKHIPLLSLLLMASALSAQTALPLKTFTALRDSATSMDVIMMLGKGGSMSVEGRNVSLFSNFFDNKTAPKTKAPQAGMIMWQRNGREFLSGNYYLGDTTGYILFQMNGKEYVNRINAQGNQFFKNQIK